MKPLAPLVLVALVSLGGSARAQSVNINFTQGAAPSPSYAAAGGAGTWNAITGVAGPTYALVGIDGSPSNLTVSQSPTTTLLTTGDPSVAGDDAALLNTGLVTTGDETCLTFSGFHPGTYEVLIYAWLPNLPAVKSRTRQDQAPSTIDVGGGWTGAHVEGVTYARYAVTVGADGSLPAHSGLVPGASSAALNGIQIRQLSVTTTDAGVDGGGAVDGGSSGGGETGDAGTGSAHHGGCNSGRDLGPGVLIGVLGLALRRRRR